MNLETREIAGAEPALVFLHEGLGSVALWRDFPAAARGADRPPRADLLARGTRRQSTSRTRRAGRTSCTTKRSRCCRRCSPSTASSAPILVGHSDGGSIALIHASEHPVTGLVLLAPHVFVEDVSVASIAEARETFESTDLADRMGRYHRDAEATFRLWNDIWLAPEFRDWNIEDVLPGVTAPALLIQGAHDQYGTLAQIDAIERGVRGPVERAVLDCRHAPHLEAPEETLAAAARFVRAPAMSGLEHHFVVPFERSFDAAYGLEYLSPTTGRVPVTPALLGADGTVQSGVYAAIAESLASTGTAVEVVPAGLIPSGLSNSTHVVADVRDGVLEATARCRARGDLEWLWDVEIGPAGGEPSAIATVAIAVRQKRV